MILEIRYGAGTTAGLARWTPSSLAMRTPITWGI
jgi:hypothetical protein